MFGPDLFARRHRRSRPFSDGARDLAAERTRVDDTSIRRVIGSLGAVLKHRLSHGDAHERTLHAAPGVIDEAARKIERPSPWR